MAVANPRVGICAIAKNEALYLEEWVEYHRLVGFGPIRVYNHESTDNSVAVLARLQAAGHAEAVDWLAPGGKKPQWTAYEHGLAELRERTDWLAFIDLDEFVVLPQHDSIQAFIADHTHLDALAINWRMFGSSGHERHEPGLVVERFTRCARPSYAGNRSVKSLARTAVIEVPRVHTCHFTEGTAYETVLGEQIPRSTGKSRAVSHDVIRINHYFTRSREEWAAKAARGRGAKSSDHPLKHRTDAEFNQNDRNEAQDTELVAFAPALHAAIAELDGVEVEHAELAVAGATPDKEAPTAQERRELRRLLPMVRETGWIASRLARQSIDADGRPLPWITYPAIDFLSERVTREMRVFEFGSGNSTLWWAQRVAHVTTVEHDDEWVRRLVGTTPANVDLHHADLGDAYATFAAGTGARYDVIVVDGRQRVRCARASIESLREGGVIVWDDTERSRYASGIRALEKAGFRRLRFVGMSPLSSAASETSVFYRADNCLGI
jgi:hypothetical protein